MTTKITVPDFNFSGFYYPELVEDLIQYLRVNCPEITDESPEEPFIQLVRAFALVGHLNNVLLDMVARERFLPTAKLRQSIKDHLALIDYKLKQASPAKAELVAEMAQTFATVATLIPAKSRFATLTKAEVPAVEYEALAGLTTAKRTDQVGSVFAWSQNGLAFTDHTANAIVGSAWQAAWGAAPVAGDALYIGHPDVMFDAARLVLSIAATGITDGVWEFFDGTWDDCEPSAVVNNGSTLTFDLTGLLGAANRAGALVRVRCLANGQYEDLAATWDGAKNIVTTSAFLGQPLPSTDVAAYAVGSEWKEVKSLTDATNKLATAGTRDVTFQLPQTVTERWAKTIINNVSAYWLRFRVVTAAGGATKPTLGLVRIDLGHQYVMVDLTQGVSQESAPLGSSTGLASQSFQLPAYPVLDDVNFHVMVTESGVESEWTRVDNFLNSSGIDKHYTLEFDNDGRATITFGDGNQGKIPEAGTDNVRAQYRSMDELDGNVGQNTITVNKSGVAYLNKVWNPRAAAGYSAREGTSEADIARLKVAGPASLRVRERALTAEDAEDMATSFAASDGTRPIARCLAIEEALGPKTMELVVVSGAGGAVSQSMLDELAAYFNGNPDTKQRGRLVLNHQVTVSNFTPRPVSVTATVWGGNKVAIESALATLLWPLAREDDGVSYTWDFGGEVPLSRIITLIQTTTPRPRKVQVTLPSGDLVLSPRELPALGTLTIAVNP